MHAPLARVCARRSPPPRAPLCALCSAATASSRAALTGTLASAAACALRGTASISNGVRAGGEASAHTAVQRRHRRGCGASASGGDAARRPPRGTVRVRYEGRRRRRRRRLLYVCATAGIGVCVRRRNALLVFVRVTNPDLTKCVDAGTGCDYLSGGGTPGPRLFVLTWICNRYVT